MGDLTQTPAQLKALFGSDLIEELKNNEDMEFYRLSGQKKDALIKAGRKSTLYWDKVVKEWEVPANDEDIFDDKVFCTNNI